MSGTDPTTDAAARWCGKRVLVTGATGFLGKHLCAALARLGATIHATTRRPSPNSDGVAWHSVDLTDRQAVAAIVEATEPAVTFHFSSLVNAKRDVGLVVPTFDAEVLSTLNILLALRGRAGLERLVLPASMEEPAGDDAPSSPYAAAKTASRAYARMFQALYETPIVLPRIFMSYGPGQPDWKLVPYLLRCMHERRDAVVGSAERAVDWIYVEDVVQGVIAAAGAPGAIGRTVDIGSGRVVTIRELAETIRRLSGSEASIEYDIGGARENEVVRCADLADMLRLCGWQPRVALEQGLRLTIDAFAAAAPR